MSHFSFLRTEDGMPDIAKHKPERFRHVIGFVEDVMRGPSAFTPGEREMIAAYVSGLNACTFCHGAHRAVAETFGVDGAAIERLLGDDGLDHAEPKLRPVLALAKKLTREPAKVVKAQIDAMLEAGWGEEAAHDLICVVALFAFANRLVSGHGVVGSPAYFDSEAKTLGLGGGYLSLSPAPPG